MKVLVESCLCNNINIWYFDKIGQIFEVKVNKHNEALLEVKGSPMNLYTKDCHVIQSIGTVLTEWEKNGGELEFWGQSSKAWIKVDDRDEFRLNSILRIKPVEQSQYRPYTFEEAKEVFTKDAWMIDKQTGELLTVFRIKEDGVFLPSCPKTEYDLLLSNFNHLDGSPCGVKIN